MEHLHTHVRLIDGSRLPGGQPFIAMLDGPDLAVWIDKDRVCDEVLQDAWDAARETLVDSGLIREILPRDQQGRPYVPEQPKRDFRVIRGAGIALAAGAALSLAELSPLLQA